MSNLHFGVFLLLLTGGFFYFKISPIKLVEEIIDVLTEKGHNSFKDQAKAIRYKKKKNPYWDLLASARKTLTINEKGSQFPKYCTLSCIGVLAGISFGILVNNPFMVPVLAVGLGTAPFAIIRLLSYGYQKNLNTELETTLSIITTAYSNQNDFVAAVSDNLTYIKNPMLKVFKEFIFEVDNVNPNVASAIENMQKKIENNTWKEWCEIAILCQENKTLRSAMNPIMTKFSDVKIVTEELSLALYEPLKQLITIALLLLAIPVLMYIVNKEWGILLFTSIPGKFVMALDVLVVFITLYAGILHSKPAEYKR